MRLKVQTTQIEEILELGWNLNWNFSFIAKDWTTKKKLKLKL